MAENQNNPGFHFTDNMVCFVNWIFDYMDAHSDEYVNYYELQRKISASVAQNPELAVSMKVIKGPADANGKWESKVRMVFPVLRYMGVVDYSDSQDKVQIKTLLTANSEPFKASARVYREALLLKPSNERIVELGRSQFYSALNTYIDAMINSMRKYDKPFMYSVIVFLIQNDYIDMDEFFVMAEFEKQQYVDGCKTVQEWTEKHRSGAQLPFSSPDVKNPWTYTMKMLEEFEVCFELNKKYYVRNKQRLIRLFGGASHV